jgi:cell division transport system permease protein
VGFRISYIALEAYRGFRRNALLATSMVIIVAISLTLLGVALLAGRQVDLYGGFWADKIEVSVFLAQDVTKPQREEIQRQLDAIPVVDQIYYETKDEAYSRFKEQFKDSPDMVRNVSKDALPESFRIKLADPEKFKVVHDQFCTNRTDANNREICDAGIDQVLDQRKLVERFFAVLNLLRNSFLVLAGVLGLAAVVLIAVTVRVAAFARRKETQIMKLVGASNTYIRLPFLAEGVFAGLLGALVAFAFLRIGMYYLGRMRDQIAIFDTLPLVGMSDFWSTWIVLLGLGVFVSGFASLIALRRYVRI